jgi:UDP-N-acetylglucosamine 2-epimerase
MLKILSVIGTRPEAIKMAPVIAELRKHQEQVESLVCITGQHREMLDQTLNIFGIQPDFDLDLMTPDQRLSQLTAKLLHSIDDIVEKTKPGWLLAEGDTTTVFASGLVSFYRQIRFGHVEAGLRTRDLYQPFPEEMNRRFADLVAHALFAPTERARQTLLSERVDSDRIYVTGNTVVDALLDIAKRPFDWTSGPLAALADKRFVLITAHRRESFGERFRELCLAICELAVSNPDIEFVYPVHFNPNVRKPAKEILADIKNISLIDPVDYVSLVHLMKRAELVLTDSGGIQEEAPTFGVPVLVMRNKTERPEGVDAGMVRLVGPNRERIVTEATRLLHDAAARRAWPRGENPYGDGKAAGRIVSVLLNSESNTD